VAEGECVVRTTFDGCLYIDRADTYIGISNELFQLILAGECIDAVSVDRVSIYETILTISAINRTVVYRVGEYGTDNVWHAELVP